MQSMIQPTKGFNNNIIDETIANATMMAIVVCELQVAVVHQQARSYVALLDSIICMTKFHQSTPNAA